jgi:hypothetical protein
MSRSPTILTISTKDGSDFLRTPFDCLPPIYILWQTPLSLLELLYIDKEYKNLIDVPKFPS